MTPKKGVQKPERGVQKPGPLPGEGGRPKLPPTKKKKRIVFYVLPETAQKIESAGGSPFLSDVVEREFEGM